MFRASTAGRVIALLPPATSVSACLPDRIGCLLDREPRKVDIAMVVDRREQGPPDLDVVAGDALERLSQERWGLVARAGSDGTRRERSAYEPDRHGLIVDQKLGKVRPGAAHGFAVATSFA
jgi:hypothetical protein